MDLFKFFEHGETPVIVVIGDTMVDRYIHGSVSRISPEAPVPVFQHRGVTQTIGGAGNVAANIVTLGGEARLVSLTGKDETRANLMALCEDYAIPTSGLMESATRCTTTKTRFLGAGQQVMRYDQEDSAPIRAEERAALISAFETALPGADCVVISDYGKGLFADDLAGEVIALSRKAGVPVIVDPKGANYGRYRHADTVTPNLKELSEAASGPVSTDTDIERAGRSLIEAFDISCVLATRSEKGLSVITSDAAAHIPTSAQEVFDVSGAGDTVVAAFALGRARGFSREDAAYIANIAAGLAVGKRGTARITAAELRSELRSRHVAGISRTAVLSWEDARQAREDWRAQGLKVGFTNGCFDILHYGHASILERARALCDRLIVGLNADASVTRLKGPTRPVNSQDDRAAVLAALRAVDAVVIFEEDTPADLITTLMPDILFKGADYSIDTVVGGDTVRGAGGEVILLDLEEGRSTTSTIARIKS